MSFFPRGKIFIYLYGTVDLLVMRIRIRVDPPLLVPTIISNAEIDQGFFLLTVSQRKTHQIDYLEILLTE